MYAFPLIKDVAASIPTVAKITRMALLASRSAEVEAMASAR